MLKILTIRDQLITARKDNAALQAYVKVLEDAVVELAEILAEVEQEVE